MAHLVNLALFSTEFGIPAKSLADAGLIDPILNCDTKLFIDPVLLSVSRNKLIQSTGHTMLRDRFSEIIPIPASVWSARASGSL